MENASLQSPLELKQCSDLCMYGTGTVNLYMNVQNKSYIILTMIKMIDLNNLKYLAEVWLYRTR